MKLLNNQKGFGLIESSLIFIAIVLVGFVVFYVFNANKKTDKSLNSAGESNQSQALSSDQSGENLSSKKAAVEQTKYLTVKEFGVKIPLSQDLQDAKYRVENSEFVQGDKYVYISSDTLDKLAQACSSGPLDTKGSNFIALYKGSGTYNSESAEGGLLKQFSNFYIEGSHPNGTPCYGDFTAASKNAYIKKVEELSNSFTQVFKKAQLIQ